MNKGKICVSVCAETAVDFIENVNRAKSLADVIELRFDCLKAGELEKIWSEIGDFRRNYNNFLLATFRSREQGGKRELIFREREEFWIHSHVFESVDWADLELDFPEVKINQLWGKAFDKVIKSFHNFEKVPSDTTEIYNRVADDSDIIKIAVQTDDAIDAIPIWKLLAKAKSENKQIIPIAMGEAGKWTRILNLAHGAFMTYAALESGKETASGQISAQDLIETYRVKELDEKTEIYGIVGNPVSHSLSPFIHNTAFKFHNRNAVFVPFEVKNLDAFVTKFLRAETREIELNFKGFSVTIPHKQAIIKHLDETDETAKAIGAVNTVKIADGKLYGFNTDAHGFIEPLKMAFGDLENARIGILGNGGAARAAVYSLRNAGAEVIVYARNSEKAKNLGDEFQVEIKELNNYNLAFDSVDVLVNATPLGTRGSLETETPVLAEQMKNVHLAYDLVYNPSETRFLREAKNAGVPTLGGLSMLIAQAVAQFKIWTNLDAPTEEMRQIALSKLQS